MTLILALLLLGQPEQYPWYEIARDRQYTHFVDILSVRVVDDRRFLRHRVDYATAHPSGAVTAEYEVEIDCDARTIALLEGGEWDEAGMLVQSRAYPQPTPRSIGPHGLGIILYRLVCEAGSAIESPSRDPATPDRAPTT